MKKDVDYLTIGQSCCANNYSRIRRDCVIFVRLLVVLTEGCDFCFEQKRQREQYLKLVRFEE